MPSLFPGIDPYLEGPEWPSFHTPFITELQSEIVLQVRPKYVVRAERRIYVEREFTEDAEYFRPDLSIGVDEARAESPKTTVVKAAATVKPVILTVPVPEEHREAYLTIRLRDTREIVSVIEILSPANKRPNSDGRREYLDKRRTLLDSRTHLVELDLLRGGDRLPTIEPLPRGDYYALVCRGNLRPRAEVYAWTLRQPLPKIPVPLETSDPDAIVDLQSVFNSVYDRVGYDYSLHHDGEVTPALSEDDAAWVNNLLSDGN